MSHHFIFLKTVIYAPFVSFWLGSSFDLAGGSPSLGFAPTAAIAAVTIPLCLFLFYASILKATAETEADDREFLKNKKY